MDNDYFPLVKVYGDMEQFRRKIERFIAGQRLLEPGDTVIVAVSGGADSVALLDVLAGLDSLRLTLVPAHLNHLLRGEESDRDEEFVRELAGRYGLTPEVRRSDVAAMAAAAGLSLEEAGREARYAFFRELAGRCGARAIAIAHHRDDQAETVLMRLLRGSAGSGLSAIRPRGDDGLLVRPLLGVCREEIEAYLSKAGLEWREDSSNLDTGFLRNRVRHELVPLLRSYNPQITENLCRTAEALARDEELLAAVTSEAFARCVTMAGSSRVVALDLLDLEPAALRPRLFRMVIAAVKGDLRRISFRHLAAVERLALAENPSGRAVLPDLFVEREYRRLVFRQGMGGQLPAERDFLLRIDGPGSYPLPGGATLVVEEFPTLPDDWRGGGAQTLWVGGAALPFPWEIRYFRNGDRFRPLGMVGEKKLKNLFIDRKIPVSARGRIPLFICRGGIFWVGGVQPADVAGRPAEGGAVLRLRLACSPE